MAYYSPKDDISFVPLTLDEEHQLFVAFYAGSLEARDTLIQKHLKLVAKLALQLGKRGGLADEDAISAGNFGLLQALESKCFDINRGIRFATYVRSYVNGQVKAALRARSTTVEVYEIDHHAEDAVITGSRSDENDAHIRISQLKRALDTTMSEGPVTEECDLSTVRREKLLKAINQLPEPEKIALRDHYFHGHNFAEIARRRNACRTLVSNKKHTTREGVRKAHNRALCKVQTALAHLQAELS